MRRLLGILILSVMVAGMLAQNRTVTPVVPVTTRPQPAAKQKKQPKQEELKHSPRPESVVETTDDLGNSVFLDTISGNEWVDSIALAQPKVIGNVYPLWDAVSVGVDLWPALGRALGQKQGLGGLWCRLSLHNRYFPTVEAGVSSAATTPSGMNFTYRQKLAPYFKVGMDYNFFYNSNPNYQIYALLRYGITRFSYDVTDAALSNGYWQDHETVDFPRQTTTTGYLELGAGILVHLTGPLSAGWNIRYHRVLHRSAEPYGEPWAIPGYGTRMSSLGVQLSLVYTIPLHPPVPNPNIETDKKQ